MQPEYLMHPNIDPVIVSVGPLAVRWYGLMYLLGLAFAFWWGSRQVKQPRHSQAGWTEKRFSDLVFWSFMGVILGGRIGYVLFYKFADFIANPLFLFDVLNGGMSFHGGLLGVITVLAIFAKKTQMPLLRVGDFVAPLVPVGLGFGRIGNFINGELWGRVSDVPWAMVFPDAGPDPRHPSQLYQAFLEGAVLFALLAFFARKPRPMGAVSGLFLIGYGCARFVVEFFRQPDAHLGLLSLGWSMGQWLSLPMILIGAAMMVWAYRSKGNTAAKGAA
ncbi:prolipoprotein diacylglyceryl transferase [Pseudidiomarina sediminum]|uniref:Phosphatidylglycerol--prolipoprotein diacylglyceryl transferase n=1 Tax=Pseudidiomarina sediminum TaxID=431675 RepID=A0A432Z9L1_9GAMM|nr:prolipoprotein diacylglyceryl transferase [Pseudidiomarina sediminum]MBY6063814.1 prolipoprotein diacylglyceryl transferase [Pseudidiomarina sediminum]RUO74623.1 prolipoprotein diacylglyceryl transferase [Pseudidiomarina sediminum]